VPAAAVSRRAVGERGSTPAVVLRSERRFREPSKDAMDSRSTPSTDDERRTTNNGRRTTDDDDDG
jgi:hypothetical protein